MIDVMKVVLAFVLLAACGKSEKAPPAEQPPAAATSGWTRKEWLAVADRMAAPAAVPPDPAELHKLVTTRAWMELDASSFAEFVEFASSIKKLSMVIGTRGSIDDLVALSLYTIDVNAAGVRAGVAFLATIPEADPTRPVRERGLEKLHLGSAIELCALLHVAGGAKAAVRDAALARLAEPGTYANLSRAPLQLILATLDEKILPSVDAALRAKYQGIRAAVAAAHSARTEPTTIVFQGTDGPAFAARTVVVVSTTGGFSISLGPVIGVVPLARRDADEHIISLQTLEGTLFEAKCSDDIDVTDTAAKIAALEGTTQRADKVYVLKRGDRDGLVRIDTIGGRGCVISAEGPRETFPAALAETFVASLRAT